MQTQTTTRPTRYWRCDPCGAQFRRKKGEPSTVGTQHCGRPMIAARTYSAEAAARHRRITERAKRDRAKLERRHAVNRTLYGSRLRLSRETRTAWASVLTARQGRSFAGRSAKFLAALALDMRACPHEGRESPLSTDPRACGCQCRRMMHQDAPPAVLVERRNPSHHGQYLRDLVHSRFEISIVYPGEHPWSTLLHEAVHWLDDITQVDRAGERYVGSHSRPFFERIDDLAAQLRYALG